MGVISVILGEAGNISKRQMTLARRKFWPLKFGEIWPEGRNPQLRRRDEPDRAHGHALHGRGGGAGGRCACRGKRGVNAVRAPIYLRRTVLQEVPIVAIAGGSTGGSLKCFRASTYAYQRQKRRGRGDVGGWFIRESGGDVKVIRAGDLDDETTWRFPAHEFSLSALEKEIGLGSVGAAFLARKSMQAIVEQMKPKPKGHLDVKKGSIRIDAELFRRSNAPEQLVGAFCDALRQWYERRWDIVDELELTWGDSRI